MILVRLIITLVIIYLLYRLARGIYRLSLKGGGRGPESPTTMRSEDLVEDPECHVNVPVSQAYQADVKGKKMHFCCRECYEKYISKGE